MLCYSVLTLISSSLLCKWRAFTIDALVLSLSRIHCTEFAQRLSLSCERSEKGGGIISSWYCKRAPCQSSDLIHVTTLLEKVYLVNVSFYRCEKISGEMSDCSRWLKPVMLTWYQCQLTGLRDIDDMDPNPWEERVRLCDRESFPEAKCIMTRFAWGKGQIEPKMDVCFTVALSVEFWTALSKLTKPSV